MATTTAVPNYDVTEWGLIPDGVTPNDTAMTALLADLNSYSTPNRARGARIYFPAGAYRFNSTIHIERCVHLVGEGAHGWLGPSELIFADDVDGLRFYRWQDAPSGGQADWSTLDGLYIHTVNSGTQTLGTGIRTSCRLTVNNVMVSDFGRYGIWIGAGHSATFGPYPNGVNANCGAYTNVDVWNSRSHGIVLDGADANANVFTNVSAVANRGWGFYDASGLGNNYFGCHTDANTLGAYRANGTAQSGCFVGCYSENGQGTGSLIGGFNILFGGNHGAGFDPASTAPHISGSSGGTVTSTRAIRVTNKLGPNTIDAGLSVANPSQAAFTWSASDESAPGPWALQRDVGGWSGWWEIAKGNGQHVAMAIATDKNTFGYPIGTTLFPKGVALANGPGSVVRHTLGYAPPTTGTARLGDVVWNGAPTPGGYMGWTCTTAGTPGTWKPFGAVAA